MTLPRYRLFHCLITASLALTVLAGCSSLPVRVIQDAVYARGIQSAPPKNELTADIYAPAIPWTWPVVVFAHGYLATPASYRETLRRLAAEGYVVIAPETSRILFPDHSRVADNMRAALTWLTAESEQPATLFTDAIRTDGFGAAGHSTGGGAALLAAARDPRVVAVSTLAAADTAPSSLDVVDRIRGAVQFACGSDDEITRLDEHQRPLFAKVTAAKQLVVLKGGSHCGFLDDDPPLGDSGSLDRGQQLELARGLMTSWFAVHLKGDEARSASAYSPGADPRLSAETVPAAR